MGVGNTILKKITKENLKKKSRKNWNNNQIHRKSYHAVEPVHRLIKSVILLRESWATKTVISADDPQLLQHKVPDAKFQDLEKQYPSGSFSLTQASSSQQDNLPLSVSISSLITCDCVGVYTLGMDIPWMSLIVQGMY